MARRKHSGEVNIGSDSFLDVIANIVGILIILIVIAGVRVSRAPVLKKLSSVDAAAPSPELVSPAIVSTPITSEPEVEPEEPEEPEFVEVTETPVELAQKVESIQGEINS